MPDDQIFPPSAEMAANAHADRATYDAMYQASVEDPEAFWAEHGKRVDWIKPYTRVKDTSFAPGNVSIKWFEDGELHRPSPEGQGHADRDHLGAGLAR